MANLLSGHRAAEPFPALDDRERQAIALRARPLAGWRFDALTGPSRHAFDSLGLELAEELDELDASPSPSAGQALVARIDAVRRGCLEAPASPASEQEEAGAAAREGCWLWYRPGRSLETGEAEIASRGLFDVKDRPPLVLWVDVRARPRARGAQGHDVAVLCWVPEDAAARAAAGLARCSSGALAGYADLALGAPPAAPSAGSARRAMDRPPRP